MEGKNAESGGKKNGEHLNHIGKDKIKNWVWMFNFRIYFGSKKKLELHLYPKKKQRNFFFLFFFGEQRGFRSSYLYFFPLNPKNINNFSFNNNLPIVLNNV